MLGVLSGPIAILHRLKRSSNSTRRPIDEAEILGAPVCIGPHHYSFPSLSLFGTGVVNEGSINCLESNASGLGLGHATRLLLGKKYIKL
jgi:hypothetical protein